MLVKNRHLVVDPSKANEGTFTKTLYGANSKELSLPMLFERFPDMAFAPDREVKHKIAPAFNGYGEIWLVK